MMIELLIGAGLFCLFGITVTYGLSITGNGLSIQPQAIQRTGSGSIGLEETLAATQAGSLTTRTDADTGTITMTESDHTIETGDVIDIYWDGGVQYGATVGTVSTTSVPIDTGSGDDLPTADTAVTVVVQSSANMTIDGDNVGFLAIELSTNDKSLRSAGHVQFVDASAAEIAEVDLVANIPQVWDLDGGAANPFTGNIITAAKISQAAAVSGETYTLRIIGVQDATP